jgi:vanillate O-demethylase monooxygenase subunit
VLDTVAAQRPLPAANTFDAADWRRLARCWHPIALVREVQDTVVGAKLLDQPLALFRGKDGHVVVVDDLCPHRGVPLSLGRFADGEVACAYHGIRFGAGGRCLHVPSNPDGDISERLHLQPYPAVERYGLIWTCLEPDGGPPNLPEMPHWDDEGFQQIVCPSMDVMSFAGRQLEGFIDVAHFAFVHAETFGDPNNVVVPSYTPAPLPNGFEAVYRSKVDPVGPDQPASDFEWVRRFRVHLPFTATLEIYYPDDGLDVLMNAASPMSAKETRLFTPIARNVRTDVPIQEVYNRTRTIFEEDRAMVEAQRPQCLPLDPSLEAHVPADRSSIAYRKGLREMGLGRIFAA